jgi:Fe-S cluster assembly protein SufD
MLLKQNNEYIHSIQNYVQAFEKNSFRHIASNAFSKWPDPLEETWRLSRLGKLTRKKIEPIHSDYKKNIHIKGKIKNAICLSFVDGAYREDLSDELPVGISLHQLNEKECLSFLSKIKKTNLANHPSTNSSLSCTPSIIKINVDPYFNPNRLIEIIYSGGMDNKSVHPVLYIELKKSSNLSIVERFNHSGTLIMPLQLIEIGELASLKSVKIFDDNKKAYNLSAHSVILSDKSNYNSFSLIKGSEFTRSETHAEFKGEHATMNLNGVYISGDDQHHDLTTAIYHDLPNCTSKQIVRGVLGGKSTGVFQGKVRVAPDAQKTDGQQMSKAILISDKASANAKPELEIYADDVVCAHGATVGELDDDQLFYLKSRGLSPDKAREILIIAFLEDIITQSVDVSLHDFIFTEAKIGLLSILE